MGEDVRGDRSLATTIRRRRLLACVDDEGIRSANGELHSAHVKPGSNGEVGNNRPEVVYFVCTEPWLCSVSVRRSYVARRSR